MTKETDLTKRMTSSASTSTTSNSNNATLDPVKFKNELLVMKEKLESFGHPYQPLADHYKFDVDLRKEGAIVIPKFLKEAYNLPDAERVYFSKVAKDITFFKNDLTLKWKDKPLCF